jgi:hypothetical protein
MGEPCDFCGPLWNFLYDQDQRILIVHRQHWGYSSGRLGGVEDTLD